MAAKLPPELKSVMNNGVPALLATCSAAGVPNSTIISQAYWVDEEHVALSFQFFNKTVRNIRENPYANLGLLDIEGFVTWLIDIQYQRSETEGPIFDAMDMQIEAIASASGMSGIFKLRAADVYRVRSVEKLDYAT
jgi:hypothetical protein